MDLVHHHQRLEHDETSVLEIDRPAFFLAAMLLALYEAGELPPVEGRPVDLEDARLVVFQTLMVMYEVHRAASRV